jgi:hypothetical protein
VEEPCKLDGFFCDVSEIANDVLRLPIIVGQLCARVKGGTDTLYACDISHSR